MPTTAEDTVQLLVACIKHSNNGKINFNNVGKDCDCTANAASKRYKGILLSHNVPTTVGSSGGGSGAPTTPASQKTGKGQKAGGSGGPSASKKRKVHQFDEEEDEVEQVEQKVMIKAEPAADEEGKDDDGSTA